jgi:hypothetical protein
LFNGTFDGNGHIISGVYINSTEDHQGLFGVIKNEGVVKNLGITASYIKGKNEVGGLAGRNSGGAISKCYFIGTVTGKREVGGIAGSNKCYATISSSYSAGMVAGEITVGGLAGFNGYCILHISGMNLDEYKADLKKRNIDTSRSDISIDKDDEFTVRHYLFAEINNSYSVSTVTGEDDIGGLVGLNYIKIKNSYYDKETSKQSNGIGRGEDEDKIIGKTTAEMKQKSTYEGWDFDKVWEISRKVNGGYPFSLYYSQKTK